MTTQEKRAAELARKVAIIQKDFLQYASVNLKIRDKDGKISPLILNEAQMLTHKKWEEQLSLTGKIRSIILKGRQQGISTLTEARGYWETSMNTGRSSFIVTQNTDATKNLFNMTKRYWDLSHPGLKPEISASNVKELNFKKLDSEFRVGTAGSAQVGRSATINFLHASELAFWDFADAQFAGLIQCVPIGPGSTIIIESTANGLGGKYHELWQKAIRGESEYWPIFIPWTIQKEYRMDASKFEPTDDELRLKEIYNLDNEQLCFRRFKIADMGADLFRQEYPFTDADAFLSSGRSVFDKEEMARALKECYTAKKRMVLEGARFVDRKDGELRVWQEPKPGSRYVIGADVSEGIGKDSSVADVLDVITGNQVAQFHSSNVKPEQFGRILAALGKWYNTAMIGCESNNHGLTVNVHLRDNERYPNIYVQTQIDDRGSQDKETRRLGFQTNRRTKPYIIDQLSALFRDPNGTGIVCKETIAECQTFAVQDDGSYSAASGCKDDRVMSMAIALYMLYQSPAFRKKNKAR